MWNLVIAALAGLMLAACATPAGPAQLSEAQQAHEAAEISAFLKVQDEAWNRGDIPAFMEAYWKSPDLRFASGGNVVRGWQATLDRYTTRYDTPEKMGKLITSDYEIVLLSPDAAIAHGHWRLERDGEDPSGLYTLVLRKFDGEWLIVSDTTTSAD